MVTARDARAIEYIQQYKVARTSTLADLFYPSYSVAARRLTQIVGANELRRERDTITTEYIYFVAKPKQIRHSVMVTDFYRELAKQADIKHFMVEPQLGSIRPDAAVCFIHNGIEHTAVVEVELSNKGFDAAKYKRWSWWKHFSQQPEIIVISDKKVPPTGFGMIKMGTDLNFKL